MAQPTVLSSNPAANAVDVWVNVPLYVTFASPGLDADSVTVNSCILFNAATEESVSVNLSYDSSTRVLTMTPLSTLSESTVYKIRFPGTDVAIGSSYVIQEDTSLDALETTVDIAFTTGTRVYIDDSIVIKDASDLSLEGDISLPTNVKALGPFSIESMVPKNHSYDNQVTLDGNNRIKIKFSKPLSGDLIEDDWVTVDVYSILDNLNYLASGNVIGSTTIPTMTGLSYSGQWLYLNFSANMPLNAGVLVTVSEDITATDGSELGPNEFLYSITTDRYPKVAGVHVIRSELMAASKELNDDYIAAVLLKNTFRVMNRWDAFDPDEPQWMAHKYVVLRSILDILDDKDLEKALVAGTSRTLGDFSVSIANVIGALTLKAKRAEDELEDIDDAIDGPKKIGARINQAIAINYRPDRLWHGVNGKLVDARFKYYQPDQPASNTEIQRTAANPNPWFI